MPVERNKYKDWKFVVSDGVPDINDVPDGVLLDDNGSISRRAFMIGGVKVTAVALAAWKIAGLHLWAPKSSKLAVPSDVTNPVDVFPDEYSVISSKPTDMYTSEEMKAVQRHSADWSLEVASTPKFPEIDPGEKVNLPFDLDIVKSLIVDLQNPEGFYEQNGRTVSELVLQKIASLAEANQGAELANAVKGFILPRAQMGDMLSAMRFADAAFYLDPSSFGETERILIEATKVWQEIYANPNLNPNPNPINSQEPMKGQHPDSGSAEQVERGPAQQSGNERSPKKVSPEGDLPSQSTEGFLMPPLFKLPKMDFVLSPGVLFTYAERAIYAIRGIEQFDKATWTVAKTGASVSDVVYGWKDLSFTVVGPVGSMQTQVTISAEDLGARLKQDPILGELKFVTYERVDKQSFGLNKVHAVDFGAFEEGDEFKVTPLAELIYKMFNN